MNDILVINPVFVILVTTAFGGLASVMAIVEFIKNLNKDWKEYNNINNENDFISSKIGRRFLAIIASALYTIAVFVFNGLNNADTTPINTPIMYFLFWIALSIIAMGGYDLLFRRTKLEEIRDSVTLESGGPGQNGDSAVVIRPTAPVIQGDKNVIGTKGQENF